MRSLPRSTAAPPGARKADVPRFNPGAARLGLFDPYGALSAAQTILLLVDARSVDAAHRLAPDVPVVGVGAHLSKTDADRIASVLRVIDPACEPGGSESLWPTHGGRSGLNLAAPR